MLSNLAYIHTWLIQKSSQILWVTKAKMVNLWLEIVFYVTGLFLSSKQPCGLSTISMLSQPNSHELSQDKERRLSKVFGNKRTCIM